MQNTKIAQNKHFCHDRRCARDRIWTLAAWPWLMQLVLEMPYPLNQSGNEEVGFCAAHVIACAVFFLFLLSGFVFVPGGSLAPRHLCSRGGARGKAPFCSVFVNTFLCPIMPKPDKEFCCRLSVCLCSVWLALVFHWCLQHCTYSLALSCFLVLGDVFSSVLCVAPLHFLFLVLSSLSFFPCLVACLLLSSFLFGVSSRGICSRFFLCLRCVFCGFWVYLCVCQLTGKQKKENNWRRTGRNKEQSKDKARTKTSKKKPPSHRN